MNLIQLVRTTIVVALERCCKLSRHADACRLARLSAELDERWSTGRWRTSDEDAA